MVLSVESQLDMLTRTITKVTKARLT